MAKAQENINHFDPICGRRIAPEGGNKSVEYKRRRYFFCSEGCRHAFEQRAEKFRLNDLARMGALLSPGRVRWGMA